MDVWVISDHEGLTSRIRQSLERAESACAYVRVSNVSGCLNSGISSAAAGDVVFYVAATLAAHDFDLLRQLRTSTRASLAVVAPTTDNAVVLRAIRAGAEDFLDADGELSDEVTTFLNKTRAGQTHPTSKGRLLTVLSSHLPSDASILSTNLAASLARQFGSCALLDFHRRGGDLAILLKLAPRHTLQDLMSQQHGIDQVMFQQALVAHHSGVQLLASPPSWSDESLLASTSYEEVLQLAQGSHPIVVVSSEDITHLAQLMTFSHSDRIVLAMRLDLLSLHRAQHHIQFLRQRNVPLEKVDVVAMATGNPGDLPVAAVAKTLGVPRIQVVPDDPMTTTISINLGNPLVLESPNSPASIAIKHLAATLTGTTSSDPVADRGGRLAATARAAAVNAVNAVSALMSRV